MGHIKVMNSDSSGRIKSVMQAFLVAAAVLPIFSHATQMGDTKDFTFKGRLHEMIACSIDNGNQIIVDFKNVGISKVDSGIYIKPIEFKLDCGSATSSNTIIMSFTTASVAPADKSAMQTSAPGLWAKILKDSMPYELGTEFKILDPDNPPKFEVLLAKDPAVDLQEASFSVTGTLLAEYM